MERRSLLKSALGLSAATMLPSLSLAKTKPNSALSRTFHQFNANCQTNPALLGFVGADADFAVMPLSVEGKIPPDLIGRFYRNGAAKHMRAQERYLHLFEGDGMVHQFDISSQGISHQGKFVQTPKFKQEQQAQRFLYSGPDSKLTNSLPVSSSESINTANTNVLPINGELWALWEAGSPVALDADNLSTKGLVNLGRNSPFGNALKGLAFSAHPKVEADGTLWNFGLAGNGDIVIYQLNGKGITQQVGIIKAKYQGGMLHDFLITKDYVLLILPSLTQDTSSNQFFNRLSFNNNIPMRVLVVDKAGLKVQREYQLDSGFAFHYGNAWQDKQGSIYFDASLYQHGEVLAHMRDLMSGDLKDSVHPAKTVLFQLHANGTSSQQAFDGISEFPRINQQLVGLANQELFTLSSVESDIWSDSVRRINIHSGKQDIFVYGKDYLVEEHVPIKQSISETSGYLIGTALHVPSKRTCLNIFRCDNLAAGPIARAWLPYAIPLGFHGNFLAS